jgi:hypothetical protein
VKFFPPLESGCLLPQADYVSKYHGDLCFFCST